MEIASLVWVTPNWPLAVGVMLISSGCVRAMEMAELVVVSEVSAWVLV